MEYLYTPPPDIRRGRRFTGEAMTALQRKRKQREGDNAAKIERVAILDFETDPFDNKSSDKILPFLAVLYSNNFEPVIIWNEDFDCFVHEVFTAIEKLPGKYTIYAHNGGKFDFMFLIHKLRGFVKFKGRAIMCANIGNHELRDSFHIIPEKLANWHKDSFDYAKLKKANRGKHKEEAIKYCLSDCRYLLEIVLKFLEDFGFKISIGQAAMYKLRQSYKVASMGEQTDAYLRNYFFGGRVECLAGRGHFKGGYKLYDVNSMYPYVMATHQHPISSELAIRDGKPNGHTCFLDLECTNHGALVKRTDSNETSAVRQHGRFLTTIWEYNTAIKYGLITNVKIRYCIDFAQRSDFSKFVIPLYDQRQTNKKYMETLTEGSELHNDAKKDDIFLKLILNNAYGKFAQNPRRFKESFITDPHQAPPDEEQGFGAQPAYENDDYWIWERPSPNMRFNNVATAASITGAARAVLLEAMQHADDPIYCDTDSLMCRDLDGHAIDIDTTKLGAWKLDGNFDEVLISGKKTYAVKVAGFEDGHKKRVKVRSKGVSGMDWANVVDLVAGKELTLVNSAPTLTKRREQYYMTRRIKATAPILKQRIFA